MVLMMNNFVKLKIFFIIFIIFCSFSSSTYYNVFICASKTAKKYHLKEDCRGLSYCKAKIKKITLKEANELDRTLCGWED